MFCKNCGTAFDDNTNFCPNCGSPVKDSIIQSEANKANEKIGLSIAAFILGILGVVAWMIPILGFPITIAGVVLGANGRKRGGKGMAAAGIVLCIIAFVLTIANSAVGAYIGANGLLWFQQLQETNKEAEDETLHGDITIQNDAGEILLTVDDIQSAEVQTQKNSDGTIDWIVQLTFTDAGAEKFAAATSENIGLPLYIKVNNEIVSAPTVLDAITDGTANITGIDSQEEAETFVELIQGN